MQKISLGGGIATASVVGLTAYMAFAFGGWSNVVPMTFDPKPSSDVVEAAQVDPPPVSNSVAVRYARAVQKKDCEEVIRMTLWMRDRIARVELEGGDRADATRVLCADLQERRIEDNLLQVDGIEDKYVFAPNALLASLGTDEGRSDLEVSPTAFREWIKVSFPDRATALRDKDGRPIRSIVVGVNVSREGYILKAGIVGNLDVNYDSISYDWPA